jgi:hypothetical protein
MKNKVFNIWLIFLWLMFTGILTFGQGQTVYIDQHYRGIKKGTISQPFNSWKDLVWKEGYTYLFKCGSVFDVNYRLRPGANRITIGAYGIGERPLFRSSVQSGEKVIDLAHYKDMVVRDIEVESTNNALTCLSFMFNKGGEVINCKLHGAEWGIRNINSSGQFRIVNCEIYMIGDDGCFIMNLDSLELVGTNIHDINQKYFINTDESFSGGDCLQMLDVKYFYIHDNTLDHGATGNKFCIIAACLDTVSPAHGLIEHNHLIRKDGILIYLGRVENVLIRYNRFENAEIAIYNRSDSPLIFYNEFINITSNVFMLGGTQGSLTKIYNNTFVNINNLSNDYKDNVNFENNIISNCYGILFRGNSNSLIDYNCYFQVNKLGLFNIGNHSIKTDPMFKAVLNFDLSLKNGSPCIGLGINLLNSYKDMDGNLVPKNTSPDIGAHEFYQ